jgi:hypothetical protein
MIGAGDGPLLSPHFPILIMDDINGHVSSAIYTAMHNVWVCHRFDLLT